MLLIKLFRKLSRTSYSSLFVGVTLTIILVVQAVAATTSADNEIRVLAFGDSLTAGYGLPKTDSFPAKLETSLRAHGINVTVTNAGVSGDTTAGGRARLDWALAGRPHLVIVELGANDALRGLPPATTWQNLDDILTRLKQRNIAVLLTGMMAPPNYGDQFAEVFDSIYPRLAERHGVALYPFFLDGVAADPKLNQSDGIHPTAEGVDIIIERMLPGVLELIAAIVP
jgi:acyl-CoA thioesterase-1